MTNHAITIKDAQGRTSTQVYGTGCSPQDAIKKFMRSLADTPLTDLAALDEAVKASSGFNSFKDVIDRMIADCRSINNIDRFLSEKCGIILDNEDTGAITGWDAGGSTVKTLSTIVPKDRSAGA